MAELIYF